MFQINLMSKIGEAHLNMLFSHISLQRCCISSLKNQNITDAQDHKDSSMYRCIHFTFSLNLNNLLFKAAHFHTSLKTLRRRPCSV